MTDKTVVLVNPSQYATDKSLRKVQRFIPPISSLTVSANLESKGQKTVIFDMRLESLEKLDRYLSENRNEIEYVGVTVFVGSFIRAAREITKAARQYGLKVVWGGPLTDVFPDLCLRECDALGGPMPFEGGLDWSKIKMTKEQLPYMAYLFTSTGCPYRCTFCYLQAHKKQVMFRSAESVIGEMDGLNAKYDIKEFTIGDDNFFTDKKRALAILAAMKQKGYVIAQVTGANRDFSAEVIDAVAGVAKTIIFSIESASPEIIQRIKKPVDLGQVLEINRKLGALGIATYSNVIFGWPFENKSDREMANKLFERIKTVNRRFRGIVYFYTSLPGTPLTKEVEEQYGEFPHDLDFWADLEFQPDEKTLKYRPWLNLPQQNAIADDMKELNSRYNIVLES